MVAATDTFSVWLEQAQIAEQRLTAEQQALLHGAFRFRQAQGSDYYSGRLLSHFLLHCDCGLKVAEIARLVALVYNARADLASALVGDVEGCHLRTLRR